MKHTPGPWEIYREKDVWPGVEAEGQSVVIFGYSDSDDFSGVRGENKEQAYANARLISAAPDLLAALKAMVDACGKHDSGMPIGQALNAIIKAEGKQ